MYNSEKQSNCYFPPMLGNGDVTLRPDAEGGLFYTAKDFSYINSVSDGGVYRAGRRAACTKSTLFALYPMTPMGRFGFQAGGTLQGFKQALDTDRGVVFSECLYDNGTVMATECLLMQERNLWAIRKRASKDISLRFTYAFQGYTPEIDRVMRPPLFTERTDGVSLDFEIWGFETYRGRVSIACDAPFSLEKGEKEVTLSLDLRADVPVCFYMAVEDDLFSTDPYAVAYDLTAKGKEIGFDGLLSENGALWQAYYARGFARTDDETLNKIYKTALYHLKSYTTRWSIPVGLEPGSWHGKFFAFDEFFSLHGILGTGMTDLAVRVPRFRLKDCLEKAVYHATSRADGEMARFMWETLECGNESAPAGHWNDHIFHMAMIALGTYEYYEHTEDKAFLAEHYPIIRACAKFYTTHSVYKKEDGSLYVGKCTDLERMGPAKENPLFTLSGVIKTLEICAAAAKILETDEEYRTECLAAATGLRKNIPEENGRVVPYLTCPERSIAVFTPKFPFDILSKDDPRLLPAWQDYIAHESGFGNMYQGGKRVNPWYSAWKAIAFARMGMGPEAYENLRQAYTSVGEFDEMFEINEEVARFRPWFTTAAGIFLSAVNEMLLASDSETVHICPAFDGDATFRLSAKGGVTVEAEIKDGGLTGVRLHTKAGVAPRSYRLFFKNEYVGEIQSQSK